MVRWTRLGPAAACSKALLLARLLAFRRITVRSQDCNTIFRLLAALNVGSKR